MKKIKIITMALSISVLAGACSNSKNENSENTNHFSYEVDTFADIQILRYKVPGFESLTPKQKEMLYYLSEAALEGRDIIFDQNGKFNLQIRSVLEAIFENYKGDHSAKDFQELEIYLKRVWFSNGIHHHYGEEKFLPGFSREFFTEQVQQLPDNGLPLKNGQTADEFIATIIPVMFDPGVMFKKVNQQAGEDLILTSANNYYGDGIYQEEVEAFYDKMKNPADTTPVSYGLNSQLVKENGQLVEKVWKTGGKYSPAIERITGWLEKAAAVAENEKQKQVINLLISYYKTGNLKTFDEYSIAWVQDSESRIDFINGFIETYGDALGLKASWESVVNFKDEDATKRTEIISTNAQWFEDNSPVDPRFKKKEVKGITAKVITVVQLGGDCYPATPIGINLPNSNWIRKEYGSKSVTIENIMQAYDEAAQYSGFNDEFVWSDIELDLIRKYGFVTDVLHTDLHEILGHGSGQLLPGVDPDALKAYGATIEETRADLFGLYYIADPKLIELNIIPDKEAYKAEYYKFMMNGLMTQLTRIEPGKNIEESHMRNRQLIARWVYEKGQPENVVEFKQRDGKTFVVINDYSRLRELFGILLAEIQRVRSEGDYNSAKHLVETYAIEVDRKLHEEVLERFARLDVKPYKGFVNPVLEPVYDKNNNIADVKINYTEGFKEQMIRYSKQYGNLSR